MPVTLGRKRDRAPARLARGGNVAPRSVAT